jgi:hypothetical protein
MGARGRQEGKGGPRHTGSQRARRRGTARDGDSLNCGARRVCRGQDVGDGVWPVVAALLPRASQLQVRCGQALFGGWRRFPSRGSRRRMPQCLRRMPQEPEHS